MPCRRESYIEALVRVCIHETMDTDLPQHYRNLMGAMKDKGFATTGPLNWPWPTGYLDHEVFEIQRARGY